IDFSTQQIGRYLMSKGYFNAEVNPEIVRRDQRAHVYFHVEPGEPYTLRNVDIDVADTVLGNRYAEQWAPTSHIQPGLRYDADLLVAERECVYHFLRQRGYYEYLRQYMRVDVDSSLRRNQADVRLIVDNPGGQANHTKFNIDSSF